MYQTQRDKQILRLEGESFTPSDIQLEWKRVEELAEQTDRSAPHCTQIQCRLELFRFLNDWFNASEEITVYTSGSTGAPKPIRVRKAQMMESACATCDLLGLREGQNALLCLSVGFIAGKMMVVRALVANLNLHVVAPNGYPLQTAHGTYDFSAMVPMQLYNCLQDPVEKEKLRRIRTLLVGGGPIPSRLEQFLSDFPHPIFATYGMAETLSHIALRRINGKEASDAYTLLPNVRIALNESGCLVIDAPMVNDYLLVTNDRAEILPDGRFRILGRQDNVIVSGGLKIQAEALEELLSDYLEVPFAITSQPDEKFGEIVVLAVEGDINEALLLQTLHAENLPSHLFPKRVVIVEVLPRTTSGKLDRARLREEIRN
jgi:O-succinylbenzoic acid--CoA ligase